MQDYKHIHYNSSKRKQEAKGSRKLSLFFLLLLILAIAVAVYLQSKPELKLKLESAVAKHTKESLPPVETRFTFYDILASGEVLVAKDLLIEPQKEEVYIQLGAFKSDVEADNFHAELRLRGFYPQVQSLYLPDKSGHWFIVRIGKVRDEQELFMLKQQLEQNQIEYAIVSKKS